MPPCTIAFQFLQMIAGRKAQIFHGNRSIQRRQHRSRTLRQVVGKAFAILALHSAGGKSDCASSETGVNFPTNCGCINRAAVNKAVDLRAVED